MAASKKDVAKQQVKEDREKVREMYLSGKTVKEIAKETYFSSSYKIQTGKPTTLVVG